MTTVEIQFRCAVAPGESAARALAGLREVYGIRRLSLDRAALTLSVEFDASRLDRAAVARLLRQAGMDLAD